MVAELRRWVALALLGLTLLYCYETSQRYLLLDLKRLQIEQEQHELYIRQLEKVKA